MGEFNREHIIKKLRLAGELYEFALRVKTTRLRRRHPEWDEKRIRAEALRLIEAGCR